MFSSAVPVLPATSTPSSAAAVPVPSSTTLRHHPGQVARRLARDRLLDLLRLDLLDGAPVGVDRAGHDVRLQPHAAVADRLRDRGHLQRRGEQVALADRDAADVDGVVGHRDELTALAHARRRHLLVGVVHRRLRVEAEALHVALHRAAAELLADRRPDRVDGVRQRERQVDLAVVLAAEVVQRHAGDRLAVGAVDARVGPVAAAVERGRRGDDLHRRARRIAVLRRAVDERGVLLVAVEPRERPAVAEPVRVVARVRRHRQHASRLRAERDQRAPVAGALERVERDLLRAPRSASCGCRRPRSSARGSTRTR